MAKKKKQKPTKKRKKHGILHKRKSKRYIKIQLHKDKKSGRCIWPKKSKYFGQTFKIRNFIDKTSDGIGAFDFKENFAKVLIDEKTVVITRKVVKPLSEY